MTTLAARYRRFAALRLWLLAAMAVVLWACRSPTWWPGCCGPPACRWSSA